MKKALGLIIILVAVSSIYLFLKLNSKQNDLSTSGRVESQCELKMKELNKLDSFEDFNGQLKQVDFSDYPEAKTFYSRITESVKDGPNFAKYFNLVYWGCGTDCFGYAVINSNTGRVIAYSSANPEYHLRDGYLLESNYFVMDPVHAGQESKFYQIVNNNGKVDLEVACLETSQEEMYQVIEN